MAQLSLPLSPSYLLGEPASEEGVKVFSIKPHKALQILSLVDVSLVLLLCQFWQVLWLDGITLEKRRGERGGSQINRQNEIKGYGAQQMKQRWNRWRRGRWSQGGGVEITHRRTRGWGRKSRGSNERELHQRGHERPREKLRVDRSWLPVPRDISLSFGRHQTCKYCTHKSCKHFRRMTHYLELGWNWDIKHNSLYSCSYADSVSFTQQTTNQPFEVFPSEEYESDGRYEGGTASISQQIVSVCVCVCRLNWDPSASSITIFSVLLRLMSFLFLRRDWLSSMSMMRMSGMVPPPMRRMVKSTIMMVVVPISCLFSMGSRPRWRLNA